MAVYVRWIFPICAGLAACGMPAKQAEQNDAMPKGVTASNSTASLPVANLSEAPAGPLSAYVGVPANQEVAGVLLADHPLVREAVNAAVSDPEVLRWVLSQGTAGLVGLQNGRLVANACEPHNCGSHNWSIVIGLSGQNGEICYHNDAHHPASRWYAAGRPVETRAGGCPTGEEQ